MATKDVVGSENDEYRIEHDTMGEVRVPAKALWRAQTQRAVENFPISGRGLERAQIRALGLLKGACAQAPFSRPNARIWVRSRPRPEIGKFSTAR